jgi:hypothetical protein
MRRYLQLYRTIGRTFGFRLRPLGTFGLLGAQRAFNTAAGALDQIFYPGFRQQPIDRPVFVLGNPRSGTTFMHRFLLHTGALCAFELWEMLFPPITARRLLSGLVEHLAPLSPGRYHSADAHEAGVRDVETDDAAVFLRFVEGGFLWSYFLAWEDTWGSELTQRYFFEQGARALPDQAQMFRYLEACWRRNLQYKGKARIIAKSSLLSLRVEDLLRRYPDCRIIYLVRDPVEAIPSGMSLVTGVLERSYDLFHATSAEARRRYFENLYQASCHMYATFHRSLQAGAIPARNLRIVPYPRIMGELRATIESLLPFLEIDSPPGFAERLAEQDRVQRSRRSSHRYDLAKFGLSEARIRSDLAFVYPTYGL